ncbi:MAG: hypothetical protein GY841_01015 [FCB group bacterium]|nr:hypothetical protein [FCB group bacterium]
MLGQAYFITKVTYLRKRILLDHVDLLKQSFTGYYQPDWGIREENKYDGRFGE